MIYHWVSYHIQYSTKTQCSCLWYLLFGFISHNFQGKILESLITFIIPLKLNYLVSGLCYLDLYQIKLTMGPVHDIPLSFLFHSLYHLIQWSGLLSLLFGFLSFIIYSGNCQWYNIESLITFSIPLKLNDLVSGLLYLELYHSLLTRTVVNEISLDPLLHSLYHISSMIFSLVSTIWISLIHCQKWQLSILYHGVSCCILYPLKLN